MGASEVPAPFSLFLLISPFSNLFFHILIRYLVWNVFWKVLRVKATFLLHELF